MLGPMGPMISNCLRSRGYGIQKPSEIEKEFTRGVWTTVFPTISIVLSLSDVALLDGD
jgi:hypothetical protein